MTIKFPDKIIDTLKQNEVHIWAADLDHMEVPGNEAEQRLPTSERERNAGIQSSKTTEFWSLLASVINYNVGNAQIYMTIFNLIFENSIQYAYLRQAAGKHIPSPL